MEELKIPLGIKDFRKMAKEGYIFADKSLLIKDIMSSGSESILFTRPRRFGKTLALSMLDRFFNIAYKEEEIKEDTFAGLKISKCEEYSRWKQDGTKNGYPVIRLDLHTIVFRSPEDFIGKLTDMLENMFDVQFDYLNNSDQLSEDQKKYILRNRSGRTFSPEQIMLNICERLYIHHKVRPILLIDEYDKPLESSYGQPWFDEFARMYGDFMRAALKGNLNVSRIILTGTQRIVVKGLFSSLNDIDHVGVLNPYFSEYFGITSNEMKDLLAQRVNNLVPKSKGNAQLIGSKFELAKSWYDGYHIGGKEIFNPWSAMNFLKYNIDNDNVKEYWNFTAENNILVTLFSGAPMAQLDEIKRMYVSGDKIFTASHMEVTPLWKHGSKLDWDDMLTLLLFAGYLTADTTNDGYLLSIPNMEVRLNFDELMERVYCFDMPKVIDLLEHITKKNAEEVKNDLERLMSGGSYLDGYSEPRYKSWLHDLFALNGYVSITERELGEGRTDLLIKGQGNKPPIVFELKVIDPDSKEDLSKVLEKGKSQIVDRKYTETPEMKGAIALSVAFKKKSCEVIFL